MNMVVESVCECLAECLCVCLYERISEYDLCLCVYKPVCVQHSVCVVCGFLYAGDSESDSI